MYTISELPHQVAYLEDIEPVDIPVYSRGRMLHTSTDPHYFRYQEYRWKPTKNVGRKPRYKK